MATFTADLRYAGPMPDDISGVDEACLQLARHTLPEPHWTELQIIGLAHALQQLVAEYRQEFEPQ